MGIRAQILNPVVAAVLLSLLLAFGLAGSVSAAPPQDEARMLADLRSDDDQTWRRAEADLTREWSKSGSAAIDLLLERGQSALDEGDAEAAIGHLTALIDAAPDFAEAYNQRASAYYQTGLYGPAASDLGRALVLNPQHFGALSGLGVLLEEIERPADAIAAYRAALAIHPHLDTILDAVKRLDAEVAGQAL